MARRKDGKLDRRTAEYHEAVDRMAKARRALAASRKASGRAAASAKAKAANPGAAVRRADGRLDQRTAEGRAMAERMAAMRAKRGKGKSKSFFAWLFGG